MLEDKTLQSIIKRSATFGPRAARLLAARVEGVEGDTATLTDLTAEIEADNETTRQQIRASDEDEALNELRRRFG